MGGADCKFITGRKSAAKASLRGWVDMYGCFFCYTKAMGREEWTGVVDEFDVDDSTDAMGHSASPAFLDPRNGRRRMGLSCDDSIAAGTAANRCGHLQCRQETD